MASIDKLYAYSKKDFLEFYNWCNKFKDLCRKEIQQELMDYFYTTPETFDTDFYSYTRGVPICNFPIIIDKWLAKHCPIKWVREDYLEGICKEKDLLLYIDKG